MTDVTLGGKNMTHIEPFLLLNSASSGCDEHYQVIKELLVKVLFSLKIP